jgi:hypothetical protein
MKNTPQELKELFPNSPDAIERMLLVTMLQEALAGSPVAGAALHCGMETTQPVMKNAELGETHKLRKEICGKILSELAAHKFVTPEETYGADIAWAVADMSKALGEAMEAAKGWRVPQRGDRLRLVKPVGNQIYGHDWIAVGDIVTCEANGLCIDGSIAIPSDTKNGWLLQSLPGVQILKPGDDTLIACLPLDCFEPVTETTNQGTK